MGTLFQWKELCSVWKILIPCRVWVDVSNQPQKSVLGNLRQFAMPLVLFSPFGSCDISGVGSIVRSRSHRFVAEYERKSAAPCDTLFARKIEVRMICRKYQFIWNSYYVRLYDFAYFLTVLCSDRFLNLSKQPANNASLLECKALKKSKVDFENSHYQLPPIKFIYRQLLVKTNQSKNVSKIEFLEDVKFICCWIHDSCSIPCTTI